MAESSATNLFGLLCQQLRDTCVDVATSLKRKHAHEVPHGVSCCWLGAQKQHRGQQDLCHVLLHLQTAQLHIVLSDCLRKQCWDCLLATQLVAVNWSFVPICPAARQVRSAADKLPQIFTCIGTSCQGMLLQAALQTFVWGSAAALLTSAQDAGSCHQAEAVQPDGRLLPCLQSKWQLTIPAAGQHLTL